jgi:hypothetical protein
MIAPQRSMPAWCAYRDAARAEHVATETAAAYQRAPLRVFGEHDDGTLAQMRNCMGVGNVVAGVICADGHLGYAQPIGGVIAYEKQISISGVGFDIGCGNMAVRLDTPYAAIEDKVVLAARCGCRDRGRRRSRVRGRVLRNDLEVASQFSLLPRPGSRLRQRAFFEDCGNH